MAASEAAALAEAVQAQVGDTLSNDTQKTANGIYMLFAVFLCYPKSVIRLGLFCGITYLLPTTTFLAFLIYMPCLGLSVRCPLRL